MRLNFNRIYTLFKDWKVLILSFAGAATFWFFNALNKDYNDQIDYPIEFVFDRDSLVVIQPLPEYIEIDVSGGGWDLFRKGMQFRLNPIKIELKNPAETRFLTKSSILPIVINQLNQFNINFLFTDTLFINIDRKILRKVTLEIDSAQISLNKNYRIVSPITLKPDTAIIYGPAGFVDTLPDNHIVPILAKEIDHSFDHFVTLGLPNKYNIHSDPATVHVQFNTERFDNLEIPIQVELLNFPRDSSAVLTNNRVTLKFVMRRSLREDFFSEDFKVIVDHNMISKKDSTAPVIVIFYPENVLEVEVEPDTLKIQYRE